MSGLEFWLRFRRGLRGPNDLDCGRASPRKAFHCARRWNADSISGSGTGGSPICREFIVV